MVEVTTQSICQGPLKTARLGSALIVDLTAPQRTLVLQRGGTLPRASVLVTTAARRIIELSKGGEKVESLILLGSNGDPTMHPDLREITENLRALRDKWFPRAKLCIFSECFELGSYDVRQTLSLYDKFFLVYEWGTTKTFSTMTGLKGTVLTELTKQLASFDHLIIQARFCKGDADNSTDSEINGWIKRLREVQPQEVHIMKGVQKRDGKKLRPPAKNRHQQIADEVAEKTGLSVTVHDEDPLLV